QPVEVRVIKRQEDYKPKTRLFKGSGHRLGSPATLTRPAVLVDQSQPVTSIQIRLGDGSRLIDHTNIQPDTDLIVRLIAKLNHTHTVGDIRHYIEANNAGDKQYSLQTTFPVKQLQNINQTIKEAGLLNSVIVQRYQ
ncbi:hypothetical protein CU098_001647, partial [Rhizopus stolonifer]